MRAAPAFQVSLRCFGIWRGAVVTLAATAMVTTAMWLITQERPVETVAWPAAGPSVAAVAGLAARAVRVPPVDLGWDGRARFVGPGAGESSSGELDVAIDLGRWLLLRFTPAVPTGAPAVWLPVQRPGIEPQWHAPRRLVYSPRPTPGDDATGGG